MKASSSTHSLSKKQWERHKRVEAKQQKRQERARKKRPPRGQQRAQMHEALHKIGAKLEKGGKQKEVLNGSTYTVNWRSQ